MRWNVGDLTASRGLGAESAGRSRQGIFLMTKLSHPTRIPAPHSGWRPLGLPPFGATCRRVFDNALCVRGFALEESTASWVTYSRRGLFLEFNYYPEECPRYCPIVSVGAVARASGDLETEAIGLWRVVYDEVPDLADSSWHFSDEQTLTEVLARIRDELVLPIALLLLDDPERREKLLATQRCELRAAAE